MNNVVKLRILYTVDVFLITIGIVISIQVIINLKKTTETINHKKSMFQEAEKLEGAFKLYDNVIQKWEKEIDGRNSKLDSLLTLLPVGINPDFISPGKKTSFGNRWATMSYRLQFDVINISDIMGFVEDAEKKRPPWKLVSCDIRARPGSPGYGNVTLMLSTVHEEM